MSIFNQFSFALIAVAGGLILGAGLWSWRQAPIQVRLGIFVAYLLGAAVINVLFRYPSPTARSVKDVEAVLANGQPTFMMFYSNY